MRFDDVHDYLKFLCWTSDKSYMDDIRSQRSARLSPTHRGWGTLSADLHALDGHGDLSSRRRGVALRLVAAGLTPELLEAVLPGWGRYLDEPESACDEAVA